MPSTFLGETGDFAQTTMRRRLLEYDCFRQRPGVVDWEDMDLDRPAMKDYIAQVIPSSLMEGVVQYDWLEPSTKWKPPEFHHVPWSVDGCPFARFRFSDTSPSEHQARLAYVSGSAAGKPAEETASPLELEPPSTAGTQAEEPKMPPLNQPLPYQGFYQYEDEICVGKDVEVSFDMAGAAYMKKDVPKFVQSLATGAVQLQDYSDAAGTNRVLLQSEVHRVLGDPFAMDKDAAGKFVREVIETFPPLERDNLLKSLDSVSKKEQPPPVPTVFSAVAIPQSLSTWEGHCKGAGSDFPPFGAMYGMHQGMTGYNGI